MCILFNPSVSYPSMCTHTDITLVVYRWCAFIELWLVMFNHFSIVVNYFTMIGHRWSQSVVCDHPHGYNHGCTSILHYRELQKRGNIYQHVTFPLPIYLCYIFFCTSIFQSKYKDYQKGVMEIIQLSLNIKFWSVTLQRADLKNKHLNNNTVQFGLCTAH